ncbi:MAG: response regulator [Ignavibacteriales bacterium]|nr:response regulator [Ignavibacteriales bacterium]
MVEDIYDEAEILWIDTYSGLVRFNLNTGEAHRFLNEKNNPHSLIHNQINKIMMDKSGVIWIATENGISFYSSKSNKFNSYFNNTYQDLLQKINNKENLQAISQSKAGIIWLGFADGLVSVDISKNKIDLKTFSELSKANIWSISSNDSQRIWIGTFGQGLKELNPKTGNIKEWLLYNNNYKVDVVLFVKYLLEDSKNNLWIGYWGSSLGTIQLSSGKSYVWYKEPGNEQSISHSDVWTIKEDRLGRIWVGTLGGGINLFNKIDSSFIHFKFNTLDESSLTSNNIYSICESKKGQLNSKSDTVLLWIGTSNGLNRVLVKNKKNDLYDVDIKVKSFTTKDGLGNNSVNSIVEDDNGNLWIGTGSGITFFDIKNNRFSNFTESDGLNGIKMNYESAMQMENGLMLFGSTKGLNIFDPAEIELSKFKPQVVFTDFQIFNQSIEIDEKSVLKESISKSKLINLPYDKNVFSFQFAALDYNSPGSIKYSYKMDGFDKDWIESGSRRFATYTNLDPGTYKFIVKATNADGVWNENYASIKIIISPPWWRTPWAYGLYIILIGLGLLIIRRIELNRTKLRNELKIIEFEANKKTELEKIKSRFFANLSHEFRTPLMLIKGPLEQIKNGNGNGNSDNKFAESINIIERNSEKLKELIDQLLELSQLENAAIPIKAKKENIFVILKGLVASFNSLGEQKNIKLDFTSNLDSAFIWIDRDKFEKVIINLLSNAFKFTPEGGIVQVTLKHSTINEKEFAEIIISDSGIGIAKQKLDKIFDRFYQVDDSTQRSYGGSGIGLALVKEFVQLHKWSISVENEEGNGAQFTLKIPMWDDYLNDDDKILSEVSSAKLDNENYLLKNNSKVNDLSEVTETKFSGTNKQSILIVDDSDDVRKYLSSLLKDNYDISESTNGEEGIKSASEILPDLIISDVMMPSMDGFEFCEKIKSNWQTSDIPVILLTAKASFESRLEGLEMGADDYLTKPFDTRELFIRIKNLLEQRRRVREKYSGDLNLIPDAKQLNTSDNDFIKKAVDLINKNLDNVDFNTDKLAKELFMSRTQLHRKFLSITEQAPGEFIRTIKLNRAAKLLVEKNLSVTQIAFEVGFSSPAQFTRAFTKQFNCVPSEYSQAPKS